MPRRVFLFISDTHAGHVLGLLNPRTSLVRTDPGTGKDERWTPELTETQRQLWEEYTDDITQAVAFTHGDELLVAHVGDVTQGENHGPLIPQTTLEDQRQIGYMNMVPLATLPNVKTFRFLTGTAIHVPESAEARIAAKLRRTSGKDAACYHHERASVDGVVFDLAHHGPPPGSRDWLEGNVALYYLRDRIYRDRRLGKEPASVYVRGHFHHWVHVTLHETYGGSHRQHDLVVLPSFCGLGDYARKVTRTDPSLTTGIGLFEVDGGRLGEIRPVTQVWDLREEEAL